MLIIAGKSAGKSFYLKSRQNISDLNLSTEVNTCLKNKSIDVKVG